jgi:hypothetical protein
MLLTRAVWLLSALAVVVVPGSQGGRPSPEPTSRPLAFGVGSLSSAVEAGPVVEGASFASPGWVSFDDLRPRAVSAADRRGQMRPASRPRPPKVTVRGRDPRPGTPQAVLAAAYRSAVLGVAASCHLGVWHLAAIGQLESGSVGGRSVVRHRVSPAIYGPLLDGGPFAVVVDSDGGRVDGAGDYDRAVGPLQFLPGTWRWAGRDGDADGIRDPPNVFDAAAATAGYLCRDGRDLSGAHDLRAAYWSYNQSAEYVSAGVEWADFFKRNGLAAMDAVAFRVGSGGRASDLGPAAEPEDAVAKTSSSSPSPQAPARPRTAPTTAATTTAPPSSGSGTHQPGDAPDPTLTPTPDPTAPPPTDTTPHPVPQPTTTVPADGPAGPAPQPPAPAGS